MRLCRLLTAVALPLAVAAGARADDAAAPQPSPWKSAITATAYNPSRYAPPSCAPPPTC